MGNVQMGIVHLGVVQRCVLASLSAWSLYLVYAHVYRSHLLLRSRDLGSAHLPSLCYLYLRYLIKAAARRRGRLYPSARGEVSYTVVGCRLDPELLRRFCSVAGYGWDYPDSEFRDLPLCFPEFLCSRLLLTLLTDGGFRLSPAGLLRLRQTLRTLEPVDELKKGPFSLQAGVLGYRRTEAGVEADVRLSASSRTGSLVWESVLTLVSQHKLQEGSGHRPSTEDSEAHPAAVRVQLKVPWTADLPGLWPFSQCPPRQLLLSLPARLLGFTSPGLWMLSVCLAEVEKHKGVRAITAPANVSVWFRRPLPLPSRLTLEVWESNDGVGFRALHGGVEASLVTGLVSRP